MATYVYLNDIRAAFDNSYRNISAYDSWDNYTKLLVSETLKETLQQITNTSDIIVVNYKHDYE